MKYPRKSTLVPASFPRSLAALALASMLIPHASALPAQAANGDLACPAGFQANFTPPLNATNTSATVSMQVMDLGCVSPNGAYPNLKSAVWTGSGTVTGGGDPCGLLLTTVMRGRMTWSPTGQQSIFRFDLNLNPSAGDVTATVTITGGVLAGDTVTGIGPLAPNADCAINGLTSLVSAGVDVFA